MAAGHIGVSTLIVQCRMTSLPYGHFIHHITLLYGGLAVHWFFTTSLNLLRYLHPVYLEHDLHLSSHRSPDYSIHNMPFRIGDLVLYPDFLRIMYPIGLHIAITTFDF